jgi:hypothetical protein
MAIERQFQPTGLETLYFDPEWIHRAGSRETLWQLTDLKWNSTTRFLSVKTHKEFDCENSRVRVLQVIEFSRQMGTGRSRSGYIENGNWQPVGVPTANLPSGRRLAGNANRRPVLFTAHPPLSNTRRRNRERTRTDAASDASRRSLCSAYSRSRPRSDPR